MYPLPEPARATTRTIRSAPHHMRRSIIQHRKQKHGNEAHHPPHNSPLFPLLDEPLGTHANEVVPTRLAHLPPIQQQRSRKDRRVLARLHPLVPRMTVVPNRDAQPVLNPFVVVARGRLRHLERLGFPFDDRPHDLQDVLDLMRG